MVKDKILLKDVSISFGGVCALKNISMTIHENEILSVIGPSNSGKTSFLRALNRLNDIEENIKTTGQIFFDGKDITRGISPEDLRKKVGMIFALPMPLPLSTYDNVSYGPRMAGNNNRRSLDKIVEDSLRAAFLWDEVKDRLNGSALKLIFYFVP